MIGSKSWFIANEHRVPFASILFDISKAGKLLNEFEARDRARERESESAWERRLKVINIYTSLLLENARALTFSSEASFSNIIKMAQNWLGTFFLCL